MFHNSEFSLSVPDISELMHIACDDDGGGGGGAVFLGWCSSWQGMYRAGTLSV